MPDFYSPPWTPFRGGLRSAAAGAHDLVLAEVDGWRRRWHPTRVLLPGKSHGRRGLVGCRPWDCKESDTTERLHFHFLLSCIREGNGNPLQCSCLENPRDGGGWWAAIYGVTQSQTRLKRLRSLAAEVDGKCQFVIDTSWRLCFICGTVLKLILWTYNLVPQDITCWLDYEAFFL